MVFMYFIEEHPTFLPVVEPIFTAIAQGETHAMTSTLTLLATLVVSLRLGNRPLANQFEAFLSRSHGLRLMDLDRPLLRAAAELRARHAVKTPDALQLAAALLAGASSFVTNDRPLPELPGLRVFRLCLTEAVADPITP